MRAFCNKCKCGVMATKMPGGDLAGINVKCNRCKSVFYIKMVNNVDSNDRVPEND